MSTVFAYAAKFPADLDTDTVTKHRLPQLPTPPTLVDRLDANDCWNSRMAHFQCIIVNVFHVHGCGQFSKPRTMQTTLDPLKYQLDGWCIKTRHLLDFARLYAVCVEEQFHWFLDEFPPELPCMHFWKYYVWPKIYQSGRNQPDTFRAAWRNCWEYRSLLTNECCPKLLSGFEKIKKGVGNRKGPRWFVYWPIPSLVACLYLPICNLGMCMFKHTPKL